MGACIAVLSVPAAAGDRCEGTFCDLYYEHMASPQPPATAPTQATPAQAIPAANPNDGLLAHLFSGGSSQQSPRPGRPSDD